MSFPRHCLPGYLWLLLLTWMAPDLAAQALASDDLRAGAPLGQRASYLVDERHTLDLDEAQALYRAGAFRQGRQPVLSFGFFHHPVWVRLAYRNDSDQPQPLRLIVNSSWLDHLDVYLLTPGQPATFHQRGDTFPFAQRGNRHLAFRIDHPFPPGITEIYLRVQTRDALVLPIFLLTPNAAEQRGEWQGISYSFFYGYIGALVIINLVLYFALKDRRHLLYAATMGSFLLLNLAYSGHAYRWLWPQQIEVQRWSVAGLIVAYCCCSMLFAMRFLETERSSPRTTQWLCRGMIGFATLIAGCALITGDPQPTYQIAFTFVLFFSVSILWLGVIALRRAANYSRYFFLATVASMTGSTVTALSVWGAVPYSEWTHRAAEIGLVVDGTLLAVALGIALRALQSSRRDAEHLAARDTLTGLLNRRALLEMAHPLWSAAQRDSRPMSLIMMDIDHFKMINDNYGHSAGDAAIKAIATTLARAVRGADLVARWGGEEFLLLLPDSEISAARQLAERLRDAIALIRLPQAQGGIRLTASFGVCERKGQDDLEQLVHDADMLLYQAKATGRDRICVA